MEIFGTIDGLDYNVFEYDNGNIDVHVFDNVGSTKLKELFDIIENNEYTIDTVYATDREIIIKCKKMTNEPDWIGDLYDAPNVNDIKWDGNKVLLMFSDVLTMVDIHYIEYIARWHGYTIGDITTSKNGWTIVVEVVEM